MTILKVLAQSLQASLRTVAIGSTSAQTGLLCKIYHFSRVDLWVGDVSILRTVLLLSQQKKDLISEGQLAREMGLAVNAKNLWKRAINEEGELLIEGLILDEGKLYVVNPTYFPANSETLHAEVVNDLKATISFAGMVNAVEETEEERLSQLIRAEGFKHAPTREPVPGAALDVAHETRLFFIDFPVVRPHNF